MYVCNIIFNLLLDTLKQNNHAHVCKYRFKGNMPQTESKRTLLKNSISSDWKGSSSNHRAHRPMRSESSGIERLHSFCARCPL